jgi:hypothetical protein
MPHAVSSTLYLEGKGKIFSVFKHHNKKAYGV